jgi:hypothetical protein
MLEREAGSMKTWHVLTVGGLLGVASLLFAPLERLIPIQASVPIQASALELRALAIIQPTLLTLLAGFLGGVLAPKVGLKAPLIDALSTGGNFRYVLRGQLPAALWSALAASAFVAIYGLEIAPELSKGSTFPGFEPPLVTKILYGGITEEVLTRWGLLSALVWSLWRLAGRPVVVPVAFYWTAVVISAFLFASGHLPLLFAIVRQPPAWIVATVVVANVGPGLLFGWLFWRRGIEAAAIAHGLTHVFASAVILVIEA